MLMLLLLARLPARSAHTVPANVAMVDAELSRRLLSVVGRQMTLAVVVVVVREAASLKGYG